MKIIEAIMRKSNNLYDEKIPTIVFFGDSVTQGCFDLYMKNETQVATYFDKNSAYHNYVAKIFSVLYPNVPINIINSGISGANSQNGVLRVERDILSYNPDLTVVCFGLNDCSTIDIDTYYKSLKEIFSKVMASGSDVIFMTPNMMNTKISCHLKEKAIIDVANACMQKQNEGMLEKYLNVGKKAARECGIIVCDVYSKWKLLEKNGVDTTELLANKINHPSEKMNWLFAYSLVETIMNN